MSSLLFLAPADLGETVLATGALAHALREGDALTVVATPEAAPLFRAAPGLLATRAIGHAGIVEPLRLWMDLARKRFDLIIDARGGVLGGALPGARRVALAPAKVLRHRAEEWADAMGVERALAPTLWLDDAARTASAAIAGDATHLIVVAPGGASEGKRWSREGFAAVTRRLATGPLNGARVVALGVGERDAAVTRAIVASLDADGVAAVDCGQAVDLLAAAALLERATLCIGNDNALTHIAAAMNAPTLTLFGATDERVRAPFGARTRSLRGRSLEELAALDGARAMEDVSIDAVEAAALDLLHAGGLR